MVATPSTMVQLGTKASLFSLLNPSTGNHFDFSYSDQKNGTLIAFICNHCPYVIHILPRLTSLCNQWLEQNINVILISSNDVDNYPADSPVLMKELAEKYQFKFPYLYDEKQEVALAYQAACTPDFFLFDSSYRLFYRGQFDASRPGNDFVPSGNDLEEAVKNLLSNSPAPKTQIPSLGCNLKWKQGKEPDYFASKV
jgi:peroxiredoxin